MSYTRRKNGVVVFHSDADYPPSPRLLKRISEQGATSATPPPLQDKDEQGRAAWAWLHAEAAKGHLTAARLQTEFRPMIPAYGCACLREWDAVLASIPFRAADQFAWSVEVHNAVSARIPGKPQFTVDQARAVLLIRPQ
jgi:hypothetical protein